MKLKDIHILLALLAIIAVLFLGTDVNAQKPEQRVNKQKPAAQFRLRVSTKDLITLSLKAEKAPLPTIAAELSKKLKVPVLLGTSVQSSEVTTTFTDLTLEPALHMLAPSAYIDYEVNHAPGVQPQPVGIYLNGYEDKEPAISAVVSAKSEAILIEGNTEDEPVPISDPRENPLIVVYEQNSLTVKAKRQPLSVVLFRIAEALGVPFELKWETPEIVDVDISKLPLDAAMQRLSPQVRLYVRANLQSSERRPFRMVLVRPESGS